MKSRYIPFLWMVMLWLSACGNNSGNPGAGSGAGDSYVNAVAAIAADTPEDSEPLNVESLTPTYPETGEPQSVL